MKRWIGAGVALAALGLAVTTPALGENLYRWKDSDGKTVMSDRPPPAGVDFETISTRSSVVHRIDEEAQVPATPPPQERKPAPAKTAAAPANSIYKKNPEYCASARQNLQLLDSAPRIRAQSEDGEISYMSDEQREAEREKALEVIAAHCD